MRLTLLRRCRGFNSSKMFDEAPEELEKMKRRNEIRQKLKLDFNRFQYNPYSSAYGIAYVDPQFERFNSAKYFRLDYWKPTLATFIVFAGTIFFPYFLLVRFDMDQEEYYWEKTQSGELNYHNRKLYNLIH
ncbi:uncharacterized protein LOC128387565 [Panonychus citri]|uniref:uncharacterized protein LOC128387565 n=1 Tax=Panonychus citri TaxID=50023 RepID=UPI00230763EB|nr:uncharacterized protein LOC128387565 [Panonychus citri]